MFHNVKNVTPQHAFDVLSVYLLVQPKLSKLGEICRYREIKHGKCVNMCAAGLFIPESDYTVDMEKCIVNDEIFDEAFDDLNELRELIGATQEIHDDVKNFENRYEYMRDIAEEFGLNTVILDNMHKILPGWKSMK